MPGQIWNSSSVLTHTHHISSTVHTTSKSYPIRNRNFPCILMRVDARASHDSPQPVPPFSVPCLACSGKSSTGEYIRHFSRELFVYLRFRFPSLPPSSHADVAMSFSKCADFAQSTHRCPQLDPTVQFNATHTVHIDYEVRLLSDQERIGIAVEEEMIRTLSDLERIGIAVEEEMIRRAVQVSEEEAAARVRARPAAKESIRKMVEARTEEEFEEGIQHECVICMEEIETRSVSLEMPCMHTFHEGCLVKWLDTSYLCPLCRYELPREV